ncbi:GntR family transcriptional regulator [Aeromonas simiae]|uniref:GntR family transcriptional regulator n=1 Tax=Aeromonas simiae TaxID=218936 RepID=UPI0005A94167|nr:GntR family transcriptional regulator [Aeromonas simiae]MDO2948633.1 GntR family transcriptional regulator [Aeromonas simiae]MDO2952047.1 GntR family transcriptional regulator [Aeromonas simiae]MDO2956016.1 GntR family transcriptional regulator [Aeromonas simiae]
MSQGYTTRTQMVVDNLRARILSGELPAGAPLRQDALARELMVSRIPVREALMQLEAQGLVKFAAHRGAVVTALDAAAIDELFYLRALLEADTLFHAVDLMTEATFAEAESILAEFDQALESGTQVERWAELNHRFHATLYRAAGRPQALELIAQINLGCDRYVRFELLFASDGVDKAEREHAQLLTLCRERRKHEAVVLLQRHIADAAASVKRILQAGA